LVDIAWCLRLGQFLQQRGCGLILTARIGQQQGIGGFCQNSRYGDACGRQRFNTAGFQRHALLAAQVGHRLECFDVQPPRHQGQRQVSQP